MMPKLKSLNWSDLNRTDQSQNAPTENFESLVDLFTLISIVLIISTFIFGYQRREDNVGNLQTIIEFREVRKGDGTPVGIPENTLIVMHTVENNKDLVILMQSGKPPEIIFYSGQYKSLWKSLEENKSAFMASNDIQILLNSTAKNVNSELVLTVQKWLAKYQFKAKLNFNDDVD